MGARSALATYTVVAGTIQYDQTANNKFGDYVRFNTGDNIRIDVSPRDSNFYLNSSNAWTIEFWFKTPTAFVTADLDFFSVTENFGGSNVWLNSAIANKIFAFNSTGNTLGTELTPLSSSTTFKHFAVVSRGDGNLDWYFDGNRIQFGEQAYSNSGTIRRIHLGLQSGDGQQCNFDVDEVRISNNRRYTGSGYTIPTAAFTDDDNTLALFHFDDNNPIDDGSVEILGSAALTSTASMTCRAGVILTLDEPIDPYTWDTVPSDTWDTFTSNIWGLQGLLVTANATLSANGGSLLSGAASFESSTTFTAAGGIALGGIANLICQADVSVNALKVLIGSASVSNDTTVTADSVVTRNATANLTTEVTANFAANVIFNAAAACSTEAQVTCDARNLKFADIYVDNFATMTVTAGSTLSASSTMSAETSVSVQGLRTVIGSTTIINTATVTVSPLLTLGANSNLSSEFTLTSAGLRRVIGTSTMSSSAVSTANGFLTFSPIINVGSTASLTAKSNGFFAGIAIIQATSTLTAETRRLAIGQAALSSEFTTNFKALTVGRSQMLAVSTLVAQPRLTLGGQANINAFASYFPNGLTIRGGRANLVAAATTVFDGDLQIVPGLLQYKVLSETREWSLGSEGRQLPVLSETRQLEIT